MGKSTLVLSASVHLLLREKGASKQPLSGDHILTNPSSCNQEAPPSKEILIAARCNDAPIEQ